MSFADDDGAAIDEIDMFGSARIFVGRHCLGRLFRTDLVRRFPRVRQWVVVTDDQVPASIVSGVTALLASSTADASKPAPLVLKFPAGEAHKTRETKAQLEDAMLAAGCGRDSCVVAVGGGVVGDLAGFVAATFMRGVGVVQVPSTLLAMVDSSIGGKTGLNTPAGKNLIGAFHQPAAVYIELALLDGLPERHLVNGLAECVKTFAIRDADMFAYVENGMPPPERPDERRQFLRRVVAASARIKAAVVSADEREAGGLRNLLNFGHTVGHAVEALCFRSLLHGECVAIGMVKEAEAARALGHLSSADTARLVRALQACRLPVDVPGGLTVDALMAKMSVDKKTVGGAKRCVLLRAIGATLVDDATPVDDALLRLLLARDVATLPPLHAAQLRGRVRVPGSKSMSNRVLLLAALGAGTCCVRGLLHSEDTDVMIAALSALGAARFTSDVRQFPVDGGQRTSAEPVLLVDGGAGRMQRPPTDQPLYLANAGTASRFLATLCTLLPAGDAVVLTGDARHCERPMADLITALTSAPLHCQLAPLQRAGCLPVRVEGGGFTGGRVTLSAKVSSQYVSSILMSAPYASQAAVELQLLDGVAVSEPYIDMTVAMMRHFGVNVERVDEPHFRGYRVPRAVYQNPPEYVVEADASSATYPLAAAAITGGQVHVDFVGAQSLQGDAQFYSLLAAMGCTVEQTAAETVVFAAEQRRLRAVTVNMANMTDAFMTAAVLAAVADGTTSITGIANQRVKECNRIQAMVTELRKCGVDAAELDDGIRITGAHPSQLHGAAINCYNDHRIAMSFAVLGLVVPGVTVDDKDCTKKTYPEFWEHMRYALGVHFSTDGATTSRLDTSSTAAHYRCCRPGNTSTVVLIGMRGAGKTYQGRFAAALLGCRFIDVDEAVEQRLGTSIRDYVARPEPDGGWPAFRAVELSTLEWALQQGAGDCRGLVVACGGGVVETPAAQQLLRSQPYVVHLRRAYPEIVQALSDGNRPALVGDLEDIWRRREPLYEQLSSHEFAFTLSSSSSSSSSSSTSLSSPLRPQLDFAWFVRRLVTGASSQRTQLDDHIESFVADASDLAQPSFFVSLTFADLTAVEAGTLREVCQGANAVELRVDLLADTSVASVRQQLLHLRAALPLGMPVVYTVRTTAQGGAFDASTREQRDLLRQLLFLALRSGVDYVDVENCWPAALKRDVRANARADLTRLIFSEHVVARASYTVTELAELFDECYADGAADVVKVVIVAHSLDDVYTLRTAYRQAALDRPCIVLAMGAYGRLSRIANDFLTPVTHAAMPFAAAAGQLTSRECLHGRQVLGLASRRMLYLFGTHINNSPSPAIHNPAFELLGLPFDYAKYPCTTVDEALAVLRQPATLGANVTMPFKESVVPLLDHVSDVARAIGAVNTVVKDRNGRLLGYNTDWIGIARPLARRFATLSGCTALVLGAGGTAKAACYALARLPFVAAIHIWNRTADRAVELAQSVTGPYATVAQPCSSLAALPPVDFIVSTVPPTAQDELIELLTAAAVVNPNHTRCLFDVVYGASPLSRAFPDIPHIFGEEMIVEQGRRGFAIWTGVRYPIANVEIN